MLGGGRDVATADVFGAYLNAYMEDFVIVKLVGDEVDIISKLNPDYKEYVTCENGKKGFISPTYQRTVWMYQVSTFMVSVFHRVSVQHGF